MMSNGYECRDQKPNPRLPNGVHIIEQALETTTSTTTLSTTISTTSTTIATTNFTQNNTVLVDEGEDTSKSLHIHIQELTTHTNEIHTVIGVILAVLVFVGLAIVLYCCLLKKPKKSLPKNNQVFFKNPSFGLDNRYFLHSIGKKPTFLPYRVKKHPCTLEMDTFNGMLFRSIINLAHAFKSPFLD